MSIFSYTAADLYGWLTEKEEMVVLDVRNKVDFSRFKVESPYDFQLINISYFDFMEIEDECVSQVPQNKPIRVVCAKEGSAKFVADILKKHGFSDIGYLEAGIKSWGNLLVPTLINQEGNYSLYQFIRPGKASCSYGLIIGSELMLFDPTRNIDFYLEFCKKHDCTLTKTFETHLQADYIAGSRILSEKTGAEFLGNSDDFTGSQIDYTPLEDKKEYGPNDSKISVVALFTPGHTPGSTSYLIADKYLVSGDTIFIQSIGRPDLGGQVEAWSDILFNTLKKVLKLDSSLVVLPGHYMNWSEADAQLIFSATLASIKTYNKDIFAIPDQQSFLEFIKQNMRQQPDEYATIRLINANLKTVDADREEELDLGKNECAATAYAEQLETKNN